MESENFLFAPLGGVGNIGMNVAAYHFRGKWIIVDLGVGFADESMPGIDLLVPDISFISSKKDDLLGIVLTHAHEDHLGGVQYLWEELECPVYCSRFTANFLKAKVRDYGLPNGVNIPIHEVEGKIDLGPFSIDFIPMTHSIPDARLLAISCDAGTIVHTGDWKIDPTPVIGPVSDLEKLKKIGEKGVSCLICDSTNVFKKGFSGSEESTVEGLKNAICSSPDKLVAVSLFASNIARIKTICDIAKECGRSVVLLGRSLKRAVAVAKESDYLTDVDFTPEDSAKNLEKGKVLLLCTGCQGEKLAASMRLATGTYDNFALSAGDKIIFSSKVIPGNEKNIYEMFNMFEKANVKVITEMQDNIHVSGHPSIGELKIMYETLKPKCAIPVHGEYMHMTQHAKLAKEFNVGVEKIVIPSPGDIIDLIEFKKILNVQSGYFGVEGHFLHHPNGDVMKMRRRLRDTGVVIITILLNKINGKLLKTPTVFAPGVLDRMDNNDLLNELASIIETALKSRKMKKLRNEIESMARSFLKEEVGTRPFLEIQIERV